MVFVVGLNRVIEILNLMVGNGRKLDYVTLKEPNFIGWRWRLLWMVVEGSQLEQPQFPRDYSNQSHLNPNQKRFYRSVSLFLNGLLKIWADVLNDLPLVLEC